MPDPVRPVVFISYSHDSDDHRGKVLALSERLRQDGYDTRLDRYVNGTPAEGWPRWMLNRLDEASHVVIVCTETYYRRFRGQEQPDRGHGVDWEGALITNEIYLDRSRQVKFVPVLFDSGFSSYIPEPLRGGTYYILATQDGYDSLCKWLSGVAGIEPGPLGDWERGERPHGTAMTFPANAPAGSRIERPRFDLNLIRDGLIRFNERFIERRRVCGFLNGYKTLHDAIHKLQDNLEALRLAAESVRRQSTSRNALGRIAIKLKVPADSANSAVAAMEYPEDFEWASGFRSAVDSLRKLADGRDEPLKVDVLDFAVEVLTALPNRQTSLNRELVRCAKKLQLEDFNPLIDSVLQQLVPLQTPAAAALATTAKQFRDLCAAVSVHANVHDLCQKIDTAFQTTRNQDLITAHRTLFVRDPAGVRPGLQEPIGDRLNQVVQSTPDNELAQVMAQAAAQFQMAIKDANTADAEYEFGQLSESFREYFVTVDDQLLEMTGRLVEVAGMLEDRLKELLRDLS